MYTDAFIYAYIYISIYIYRAINLDREICIDNIYILVYSSQIAKFPAPGTQHARLRQTHRHTQSQVKPRCRDAFTAKT